MKESAVFTSISTRSKRHIRVIFYFPIGAGMHLVLRRFFLLYKGNPSR